MALHVYVCQTSGRQTRMDGRGDFVRLRTENRLAENEKSFAAERKIVLSRLIFQSQEIDFAFISIYYTKVYRIMILEEEQKNTKPWL